MKAIYLLDQTVNIENAPDAWREKCRQNEREEWIIPKDTVIEGPEALLRVSTGQCAPFDEECIAACGQNPEQLQATQRKYLAAEAGIHGKHDMELFMAGVIEGYEKGHTTENPKYKPGPQWDAHQAIKAKLDDEDDDG